MTAVHHATAARCIKTRWDKMARYNRTSTSAPLFHVPYKCLFSAIKKCARTMQIMIYKVATTTCFRVCLLSATFRQISHLQCSMNIFVGFFFFLVHPFYLQILSIFIVDMFNFNAVLMWRWIWQGLVCFKFYTIFWWFLNNLTHFYSMFLMYLCAYVRSVIRRALTLKVKARSFTQEYKK